MAASKPDRRREKRVSVDVAQLKVLLGAGLTPAAIGRALGVSGAIIRGRIAENGLLDPEQTKSLLARLPKARVQALAHADPALVATGGRYAPLAEYADAKGITFRVAQWRWHQLGRPVDMERERGPVADLP